MDLTVVIMTRNRADELLSVLGRMTSLPERPPIVVADNGSTDGTADLVRDRYPEIDVLRFDENIGVAARNAAVRRATTPYVAFNDDDSWWSPGSLTRVVELFDRHPRLGAVTAHVTVEPRGDDDPVSLEMQQSPLEGDDSIPGVPVLGFMACATAVRRVAFEEVGGFEPMLHFGGEEQLLATDLAAAGWAVRYVPDISVHHMASSKRDSAWRRRRVVRNDLWYVWLRRPVTSAARRSVGTLLSPDRSTALRGLAAALRGARWVSRNRRVVPAHLEEQLRRLDGREWRSSAGHTSAGRV